VLLRGLLLFLLIWVIARSFWRFVDGVVHGATGSAAPGSGTRRTPVSVKMAPCPTCGTYVVPGRAIGATSQGRALYFCSEACRAQYRSS
jgi:YHS domain-containing protein